MRLEAIVLAAGASSRFGADKLRAALRGEPLLFHAIRAARAAPVERVVVVGSEGLSLGEWPDKPRVEHRHVHSAALSESLKAGVEACSAADGVFVFLGDMPLVPHDLAGRLAESLSTQFAAQPLHKGKPGHPVLLSRQACLEIADLTGDQGAGPLLRSRSDVARIEVADEGVLLDVDRPDDLATLSAKLG